MQFEQLRGEKRRQEAALVAKGKKPFFAKKCGWFFWFISFSTCSLFFFPSSRPQARTQREKIRGAQKERSAGEVDGQEIQTKGEQATKIVASSAYSPFRRIKQNLKLKSNTDLFTFCIHMFLQINLQPALEEYLPGSTENQASRRVVAPIEWPC